MVVIDALLYNVICWIVRIKICLQLNLFWCKWHDFKGPKQMWQCNWRRSTFIHVGGSMGCKHCPSYFLFIKWRLCSNMSLCIICKTQLVQLGKMQIGMLNYFLNTKFNLKNKIETQWISILSPNKWMALGQNFGCLDVGGPTCKCFYKKLAWNFCVTLKLLLV